MTEPVPAQRSMSSTSGGDKPSLNALLPVVPRIAMPWYALGLKLGAKVYTLDSIQQNHKDDLVKCCHEMLLNWLIGKRDCGDLPRTWDCLLQVVESVVGSEASAFIKSKILNWEEQHMEQRPAETTHVKVIKENSKRFLQEMNAKAIALTLRVLDLIPERIEYHIQHSMSRGEANGHLLTYLKEDATEEQVLAVFKVASEEAGYGRMSEFAANVLQKLQQVTPTPSPLVDPLGVEQGTAMEESHFHQQKVLDQRPNLSVISTYFFGRVSVERWRRLGISLNIPHQAIFHISSTHSSEEDRYLEVLTYWLDHNEAASWRTLLEVLGHFESKHTMDQLTQEVLATQDSASQSVPFHLYPAEVATHVQVIKENSESFLQEMNSKAIALTLNRLQLIPESVKYDIDQSTLGEDANGHLLTYLMEYAPEELVLGVFKVASEEAGYRRMSEFAANVLQKLQQVTPTPSPLMGPFGGDGHTEEDKQTKAKAKAAAAKGEPTLPQDGRSHPEGNVDLVLDHFRDRFIREVDASTIVFGLENKGIIPNGVLTAVNKETSVTRQNKILYAHLEATSTKDSLMTVCDMIIAVPGNPRMRAFGEDMKSKLKDPPSVPSPSSQSGAPTADKVPSTETEALTAAQQEFRKSLKAALAQGSVEVEIVKCVTLGPPKAGKTQLKSALVGRFIPTDGSTPMSTAAEVVMQRYISGSGKTSWEPLTGEKLLNFLHRTVEKKEFTESESATSLPTDKKDALASSPVVDENTQPLPKGQQAVSGRKVAVVGGAEAKGKEDLLQQFSDMRRSVVEGIQMAGSADIKDLQKVRMVHFIDSGGQPAFLDIHPVIATSRAVYLLVYNMEEGLDAMPDIAYNKEGFTKKLHKTQSNLDMIKDSLLILYTFKEKFAKMEEELDDWFVKPISQFKDVVPVLVVGTRKKVESVESESEKLLKGCTHLPTWSDVLTRKPFAVNSMDPGCEGLQHVRDVIKSAQCTYSLQLPISWFLCQLIFWSADAGAVNADLQVLTYTDLRGLCRDAKIVTKDEKEFNAMIRTFHLLGIFSFPYFDQKQTSDQSKPDTHPVFTNPNMLYQQVTKILEVAFCDMNKIAHGVEQSLRDLQSRGMLKVSTLKHLNIEDKIGSYEGFHLYLLKLLETWGLAARQPSKDTAGHADHEYFIPSVLPACKRESSNSPSKDPSCPPDLAFTFIIQLNDEKFYYVPRGIFPHMVVNALTANKGYFLPANRDTFESRYRDAAHFQIKCPDKMDNSYNVRLTENRDHISISIQPANPTRKSDCDCHQIVEDFRSAIEDAYEKIYYTHCSVMYACPCPCQRLDKKHLAAITPDHHSPTQYALECLSAENDRLELNCPENIANIMKGGAMAPVSNLPCIPSLHSTAFPPPPPHGGVAAATLLPATDRQASSSFMITHPAGGAMAPVSNPPHIPSPDSTAVLPPPPTGGVAVADSLPATEGQTSSSREITHAAEILEALNGKADAKWSHFGTYLRIESTLIETIEQNRRGDCNDCMLDLVTKWVSHYEGTGDLPRTWQTVVEALRRLPGCRQLAIELAERHGVTLSQQ